MVMAITGGVFSVIIFCILASGIGATGGIELIVFMITAALPGMLIGGICSLKKTQDELKDELAALRNELTHAKEKKEETE